MTAKIRTKSHPQPFNDRTVRHEIWQRFEGNDWEAFDQLPPSIRKRLNEHVYDAWSVNALMLWKHYKRIYGRTARAERALIKYLDYCERLERKAFSERYTAQCGTLYPHDAAGATVLRTSKGGQESV
ncbi:DUF6525 family protein [Gluconobacter japonicus]|uniref:Uncharacterized protein n=1 Tax=Gluconobacter japonicus TaxID=376620 RepID=A0ABQ5WFT0_GLUJA|nr:DUF6525 family protein [Gluconobacter japonicus]KXV26160.1 hypothetical protein AD938_10480 [Gluconobacter japonicus]GBR23236.1 hypothetical protein AA3271_1463 [Gluconobacter japonicus NBRC 3271]GLQ58687.1 hypothetical protein GCM10010937_04900 [Gluconobacter japonicus]